MAEGTGLSVGFLSDLENGKRGCGLWTAAALCTCLGVSVGDLIPSWDDAAEGWR